MANAGRGTRAAWLTCYLSAQALLPIEQFKKAVVTETTLALGG